MHLMPTYDTPKCDSRQSMCGILNNHNEINSFIRRNNYDKFISIEMIDTGNNEDLVKSIKFVKEKYNLM